MDEVITVAPSVQEGDTIRVEWKVGDIAHTRQGTVSRIIHDHGKRSRSFITAQGNEIVRWVPDSKMRFILVKRPAAQQAELFDYREYQIGEMALG